MCSLLREHKEAFDFARSWTRWRRNCPICDAAHYLRPAHREQNLSISRRIGVGQFQNFLIETVKSKSGMIASVAYKLTISLEHRTVLIALI
jgi:hypothetical protein